MSLEILGEYLLGQAINYQDIPVIAARVTNKLSTTPELSSLGSKRVEALLNWNSVVAQLAERIPSCDELANFALSRSQASAGQAPEAYPALISFNDDVISFFAVSTELLDSKRGMETVQHELEHFLVYSIHGVPAELLIALGCKSDFTYCMLAMVHPLFPSDMPANEQVRILKLATGVVTYKSQGDMHLIRELEM